VADRARRRLPGDLWLILAVGAAAILAIVALTLAGAW
jgi:hypothetical protein